MEKNDNQKLVYYKEHPLCLYVTNKVQSTKTLLLCSRDVKNIINKITSVSENPKNAGLIKKKTRLTLQLQKRSMVAGGCQ